MMMPDGVVIDVMIDVMIDVITYIVMICDDVM